MEMADHIGHIGSKARQIACSGDFSDSTLEFAPARGTQTRSAGVCLIELPGGADGQKLGYVSLNGFDGGVEIWIYGAIPCPFERVRRTMLDLLTVFIAHSLYPEIITVDARCFLPPEALNTTLRASAISPRQTAVHTLIHPPIECRHTCRRQASGHTGCGKLQHCSRRDLGPDCRLPPAVRASMQPAGALVVTRAGCGASLQIRPAGADVRVDQPERGRAGEGFDEGAVQAGLQRLDRAVGVRFRHFGEQLIVHHGHQDVRPLSVHVRNGAHHGVGATPPEPAVTMLWIAERLRFPSILDHSAGANHHATGSLALVAVVRIHCRRPSTS